VIRSAHSVRTAAPTTQDSLSTRILSQQSVSSLFRFCSRATHAREKGNGNTLERFVINETCGLSCNTPQVCGTWLSLPRSPPLVTASLVSSLMSRSIRQIEDVSCMSLGCGESLFSMSVLSTDPSRVVREEASSLASSARSDQQRGRHCGDAMQPVKQRIRKVFHNLNSSLKPSCILRDL